MEAAEGEATSGPPQTGALSGAPSPGVPSIVDCGSGCGHEAAWPSTPIFPVPVSTEAAPSAPSSIPSHMEVVSSVSQHAELHEDNACLGVKIQLMRQETRDLKGQIRQKQRKQSDFKSQMTNHFISVAHQKQLLNTRVEGLEAEQRQLQSMEAQHQQEEVSVKARIDDAIADHSTCEARIQVLMDRLVTLLSSAPSPETMVSQIIEEFEQSLLGLDEKIQTGKARLEVARRENHELAVRLSEEQSETKRLHDTLCSLQSRLYGERFQREAPEAEEKPVPSMLAMLKAKCLSSGMERAVTPEAPVAAADDAAGQIPAKSPDSKGTAAASPAGNSMNERRTMALEERLREVLDRVSFEDPVVRIKPGQYKFGAHLAYLICTTDGDLLALPGSEAPEGLEGGRQPEASRWMRVEDFISDLRAKHKKLAEANDTRRAGQVLEDPGLAQVPPFPGSSSPPSAGTCRPGSTAPVPSTAPKAAATVKAPQQGQQVAAGDDAAGVRTPDVAELESTSLDTCKEVQLTVPTADSAPTHAPQVAAAGDDAAGLEHQSQAQEAIVESTVSKPSEKGLGGDAAGGWLRLEKRISAMKVGSGGLVSRMPEGVSTAPPSTPSSITLLGAGGSAVKKTNSTQRLAEQSADGANMERTVASTASGTTASVSAGPGSTVSISSAAVTATGITTASGSVAGNASGSLTASAADATNTTAANSAKPSVSRADVLGQLGTVPQVPPAPSSVQRGLVHGLNGTGTVPRLPSSLPASPQPGMRSAGNMSSIAAMLSPGRLSGSLTARNGQSRVSPTRIASGNKNVSPQRAIMVASTSSSSSSSQVRAQAPPALTPRQLNVGSFAPPGRSPSAGAAVQAGSLRTSSPVSPTRSTTGSGKHDARRASPPALPTGAPAAAFPAASSLRAPAAKGLVTEAGGGSITVPGKPFVPAPPAAKVHPAPGSFELPVAGAAMLARSSHSASPSHRQQSPPPNSARTGTPTGRWDLGLRGVAPTVAPAQTAQAPVWR